jgi:hypothetical protein
MRPLWQRIEELDITPWRPELEEVVDAGAPAIAEVAQQSPGAVLEGEALEGEALAGEALEGEALEGEVLSGAGVGEAGIQPVAGVEAGQAPLAGGASDVEAPPVAGVEEGEAPPTADARRGTTAGPAGSGSAEQGEEADQPGE